MKKSDKYVFVIKELFPTLNETSRLPPYRLTAIKRKWQKLIKGIMLIKGYRIDKPFETATIKIVRRSTKEPDYDNMVGGCKYLIDLFTTPRLQKNGHVKNKFGLGFFIDDDPTHIKGIYKWEKTSQKEQCTIIIIEEGKNVTNNS